MSEADRTIPTTVTRKWKRRSGFKFSTKKALECSKLLKEIAKDRILELESVQKALTYPSLLLSEIGVVDLSDYSTRSFGKISLYSDDQSQEEKSYISLRNMVFDIECCNTVSIIVLCLECLILNLLHRVTIVICKGE